MGFATLAAVVSDGVDDAVVVAIAAAREGSRAAQRQLFNAHRQRVADQILRLTGDHSAVDDLLQEVFIAAFGALDEFRGEAKIETWLYRITFNKVNNWWDSNRRRRVRERRGRCVSEDSGVTPLDAIAHDECRRRLYDALDELPRDQREAFVLRTIEGRSLTEASHILGIPISTTSYRARQAQQTLLDILGEWETRNR